MGLCGAINIYQTSMKTYDENYDENSDERYFLEVDVECLKQLFSSHKELPFLPERRKLEKVEKLVCSIEDRKICHSHKSFKTTVK